jgi:16S rRNA (guanine527-N7)-methyltransferase
VSVAVPPEPTAAVGGSQDLPAAQAALVSVLSQARELGYLGPGPLSRHIQHSQGFADALLSSGRPLPHRVVDLGSGGGVPGLVLATLWPDTEIVLLEAHQRRAQFLLRAVEACDLEDRVSVLHERAEIAGRSSQCRSQFDLVVSRSFGSPAVTAECSAPLLSPGGVLLVSEPPSDEHTHPRWPAEALEELGLSFEATVRQQFGFALLVQRRACPDRYPRRVGVPAKRPLF